MANKDIKEALKRAGLKQWQLAEILGVNEFSFSRKMRHELSDEEKSHIIGLIDKKRRIDDED